MPVPALRVRIIPRFPARIDGGDGIGVVRTGGVVTIRQDWSGIAPGVGPFDQQAYEMLGRDVATGGLIRLPLSAARAAATRRITAAGDVTVLPTDGVILINKTVPEPTSVNLLPSASGYVISIKDEGEDAGSYPITLVPDGSDLIDGQSSYMIEINGGAVDLQPVVGGWAVLTEFLGSGPLPITRGGTGAADAANARSNLGLGAVAVLNPGTGLVANGSALNLANTAVTPGSYTNADVTVDAQGRLTSVSNGAGIPGVTAAGLAMAQAADAAAQRALLSSRAVGRGTPTATTSGSTVSYTGLPSTLRKITFMLNGVSTNGTTVPLLLIGPTSGLAVSGYTGSTSQVVQGAGTQVAVNASAGFPLTGSISAGSLVHGSVMLALLDVTNNIWEAAGNVSFSNVAGSAQISGSVTLSGPMTQIAIVAGATAFDAGSVNIEYEYV